MWSNVSLESNLTPRSFSHSLFSIINLSTFKLTSWSLLVRKWTYRDHLLQGLILTIWTETLKLGHSITSPIFLADL